MTTLEESTIVTQPTRALSEDVTARPAAQAWQLGILTDRAGHVHLGAVVAGTAGLPRSYIDLLAPVRADSANELNIEQLVVLLHGKELAGLRRLVQLIAGGGETMNGIVAPRLARGPLVCRVCRRTGELVRAMGAITEPIWCCHRHDDHTIVRAWIHSLPEWQRLQAESPSNCATCNGACRCDERDPIGHRCACWPPSVDHAQEALATS